MTEKTHDEITDEYAGKGYGAFKKDVADAVIATLEPIQQRYQQLVADPELDDILEQGAAKAHAKANLTYEKVCHAMGLYRK
jgi:tryptophanyl-tRNA synthetase